MTITDKFYRSCEKHRERNAERKARRKKFVYQRALRKKKASYFYKTDRNTQKKEITENER